MNRKHSPDCDVNDANPDGIRKPCNCGETMTDNAIKEECATCRFMRLLISSQSNQIKEPHCMRHAPSPRLVDSRDLLKEDPWAGWPRVSYRDWCGEYQKIEP